jgi:hypothetical protein
MAHAMDDSSDKSQLRFPGQVFLPQRFAFGALGSSALSCWRLCDEVALCARAEDAERRFDVGRWCDFASIATHVALVSISVVGVRTQRLTGHAFMAVRLLDVTRASG